MLNKALILEKKAEALEKIGRSAEQENAEAMEAYEEVLSMEPVLPDALFNAGFFYMRLREFGQARDCFSRYISLLEESDPTESDFEDTQDCTNDEELLLSAEKKEQAEKIIRNIVEQGLDEVCYMEAYDCISRGDNEMGLPRIKEFLERRPKAQNGWFLLGWALRKLARYKDSLEAFKKAISLFEANSQIKAKGLYTGSIDIRNEMAICLMELGDFKEAKRELEQALRDEPDNITIISNLGVLALKTEDMEKAESYFRIVNELDPNDPLAKRFLNARD